MVSKICPKCKVEKSLLEFHNNKSKADGKANYCKPCNLSFAKPKTFEQSKRDSERYRERHPDKRKQIWQNYYKKHKGELMEKKIAYSQTEKAKIVYKEWYQRYKPIMLEKQRERRKNLKPDQKAAKSMRDRFAKVIFRMKKGVKSKSWRDLLGCSINDLRVYLESMFMDGMKWENHGNGHGKWNIDHIIPLCKFDLMDIKEQEKAFHYTNLRPLWFMDNMKRLRKHHHLYEQKNPQ